MAPATTLLPRVSHQNRQANNARYCGIHFEGRRSRQGDSLEPSKQPLKMGQPKGLGKLIPRWLRERIVVKLVKWLEDSHLPPERAQTVAAHELGHAIANFAAGNSDNQDLAVLKIKGYDGLVINYQNKLRTKEDHLAKLVSLVSGYVFQLAAACEDNQGNPDFNHEKLQLKLLLDAQHDISQVKDVLSSARKKGFLKVDDGIDLSPVPIKETERLQKKFLENGELTDAEKQQFRQIVRQLRQTLDYPLVREAIQVSESLVQNIPLRSFSGMRDECVEKRIIEADEMATFFNRHLSPKVQQALKHRLTTFCENGSPNCGTPTPRG